VVEAMQRCLVEACGNSASNHRHDRLASKHVERARQIIATTAWPTRCTRTGIRSSAGSARSAVGHDRSMSEATRRFLATLKQDANYDDFPQSMEEVLQRASKRHKAKRACRVGGAGRAFAHPARRRR